MSVQIGEGYKRLGDTNAADEAYFHWYDALESKKHQIFALMLGCMDGRPRLVEHIVTKDKSLVNEHINNHFILEHALTFQCGGVWTKTTKSLDQGKACAQILIDAGADVNTMCNIYPDKDPFKNRSCSILGKMIHNLTLLNAKYKSACGTHGNCMFADTLYGVDMTRTRQIAGFLVANGAKCHIETIGYIEEQVDNKVNDAQLNLYLESLKEAQEQALPYKVNEHWTKMRIVCLAKKSSESPFSTFPDDLIRLVIKNMAIQFLEKQ